MPLKKKPSRPIKKKPSRPIKKKPSKAAVYKKPAGQVSFRAHADIIGSHGRQIDALSSLMRDVRSSYMEILNTQADQARDMARMQLQLDTVDWRIGEQGNTGRMLHDNEANEVERGFSEREEPAE